MALFIGDRVGGCLSCGMAGRDAVEEASARATSRGSLLSMSRFSRNTGSNSFAQSCCCKDIKNI